jgi:hypothetical protein
MYNNEKWFKIVAHLIITIIINTEIKCDIKKSQITIFITMHIIIHT